MKEDDHRAFANVLNAYRVFPRIFVISYLIFFACAWVWVVSWFMRYDWSMLPQDAVVGSVAAAAVAGFPAIILGVLSTILRELLVSYWSGNSKTYRPTDGQ